MNECNHIKRLNEDVVNKIAAGEVVQRPGAAIKEMIENSIDAHATSIVVSLSKGGLKQIQIQDNGDGIMKEDLPILCERYTTSKLRELDDLNSISTFGFRGEALASISTVSRVMVVTKRDKEVCGWKLLLLIKLKSRARYCGNKLIDDKIEPTASTKGTCITVDDLFYNIPSRKSIYSQKESEETKSILSLLQIFSIHYTSQGISFSLKETPNKTLFKSAPSSTRKDSIANIIGASIRPSLSELKIPAEQGVECPFTAELIFSPKSPAILSPALSFILFVNGRFVQNPRLKQGIRRVLEQYYYASDTNSKSRNQSVFVYISLQLSPTLVDVNVHPNKREICFLDEEYVVRRVVEQVELEVKNVLNSQQVSTVSPIRKKAVPAGSGENETPNKKVRVDYSQRTMNFSAVKSNNETPQKIETQSQSDQNTIQPVSPTNISLLSDHIIETPFRPTRGELQLDSILSLCDEIRRSGKRCVKPREIFQKSVFIGCVDTSASILMQYENQLVLVRTKNILEEFFYQVIIFNFGCFYTIRFLESLDVAELMSTFISKSSQHYDLHAGIENLTRFSTMLDDYFSIKLHSDDAGNLQLETIPLLLIDFEPFYGYLPIFLTRLAFEVCYTDEKRCIQDIAKELARFYAYLPQGQKEEEIEQWKGLLQSVLFPQLRRQIIATDKLWTSGTIQTITSTDRLYRVFERC